VLFVSRHDALAVCVYTADTYFHDRPNGIGAMVASFALGKFLNWDYLRSKAKAGYDPKDKVALEGFPIERVRLRAFPWIVMWVYTDIRYVDIPLTYPDPSVYLGACVGFGWAMESKANVAVPLVMNFFSKSNGQSFLWLSNNHAVEFPVGSGLQAVMGMTSVLLVDLFPKQGGAITASVSSPGWLSSFRVLISQSSY
jgi:hypothetical protein